jgi:hypothetical protein
MSDFAPNVVEKLLGNGIELMPNVDELFELELTLLEYANLPRDELLDRTAYIKSINGNMSKHFLMCQNIPDTLQEGRSAFAKLYFQEGLFSTGYATHGLFPYRGKFHPQLIKALLNILKVQKGETVLDPMMGSGTTNIEAALLGVNSIGIDISPFCRFMTKVKYESLTLSKDVLNSIAASATSNGELFNFFNKGDVLKHISEFNDVKKEKLYNLAFLAWLDALGYSKRVVRSTHQQLFDKVFARYLETVKAFLQIPYFLQKELGTASILNSSALKMGIENDSIDCVITSPPYSFAIDYVENDRAQLEFLGCDTAALKKDMIGLKGKKKEDKLSQYFNDIETLCAEVNRVLKKDKYFVVIIGSNTIQTGGIRLENSVITFAKKYNMPLVKIIQKPIRGMRNTMKDEYILIFKRGV